MKLSEIFGRNIVFGDGRFPDASKCVLLLSGLLLLLTPILAKGAPPQNPSLASLLSGQFVPLSIHLKDLTARWSRMAVSGTAGRYYTKGQTVLVGGETYLIAYRADVGQLNPNTMLTLSLLNLRTCPGLVDIQPFLLKQELAAEQKTTPQNQMIWEQAHLAALLENDPEMPIFQAARIQAANTQSLSRLKQLGIAIQLYLQNNNDVFPDMAQPAQVRESLRPYIKDDELFKHPITAQSFRWNAALSGKNLTQIDPTTATVLAYEASNAPDGTRGVVFADGHTRRLKESEWVALSKKDNLP